MKFSVKTTPADQKTGCEAMEPLLLQMIDVCIANNPQFKDKLLEHIAAVENVA